MIKSIKIILDILELFEDFSMMRPCLVPPIIADCSNVRVRHTQRLLTMLKQVLFGRRNCNHTIPINAFTL